METQFLKKEKLVKHRASRFGISVSSSKGSIPIWVNNRASRNGMSISINLIGELTNLGQQIQEQSCILFYFFIVQLGRDFY